MSKAAVATAHQSIRELMVPMFAEAREKGLIFYTSYQGLYFTPDELEAAQDSGRFLWGPVNWQLRMPSQRIAAAQQRGDEAMADLQRASA